MPFAPNHLRLATLAEAPNSFFISGHSFFGQDYVLPSRICRLVSMLSAEGSPSRILRVLLISLGITILPKSSTLLTIPVAVPDIFVGFQKPSSSVDRGHSLRSLHLPQAALPSLPCCFHIYLSPLIYKLRC